MKKKSRRQEVASKTDGTLTGLRLSTVYNVILSLVGE